MNEQPPKFEPDNDAYESARPYLEAKEQGRLRQYYLDKFLHLKDDWLDDLPAVDVRQLATLDEKGQFVGDNYKCRGNYIFILGLNLNGAVEDGVISDPELIKKIDEFRNHDFKFQHSQFTTAEEIAMMNQILDDVIESMERTPEVTSEEQKILAGLTALAEEQNEMAIRFLAEKTGIFEMPGISFLLLGNQETDWQKMKLQINGPDKNVVRNFSFYKKDLPRLARVLMGEGLTGHQVDNFLQTVQATAARLTKVDDRWILDDKKNIGEL